ncbi:GntR family transcriptional regulator [Bosea sp. PAMC 26642]|uniref:GntR family transcriptional regulator n=1 Tax=Bosea sp. (strain PAMC 26642) TaxID=1792307 RepID=UPI0009EA997B|nr:FCD domain-containing protein [Bosea sp. PAMC 26642]
MTSRIAAPSLTRAVYETLRADVLACRLEPGERLKVNDLCARLGVSLGAVREALSALTAEGLVVAEAQRGFKVASVSAADLGDLTQTRIEIESLCLKRAIACGGIEWETQVVAAFHRLSRTPERVAGDEKRLSDDWTAAHREYHEALVASCDSPWLLRLRELLYAQSERYRRLSVPAARRGRDIQAEHKALMEATLARDCQRATMMMAEHLNFTPALLEYIADTSPSPGELSAAMETRHAVIRGPTVKA